jgi:CRISPR-associated endonuclease/helicase Cas3
MSWSRSGISWTPTLHATSRLTQEDLLETIDCTLARSIDVHPVNALKNRDNLRNTLVEWAGKSKATDRQVVDFLSALCSDLAPVATSQLQTVRRDYFMGNLCSILAKTQKAHLHRALFLPWDYADALDNLSLHVEPAEDRRYAYQWHRPAGDPTRSKRGGMIGANRLAIEAFPFFQSFATGDKLSTRGFTGLRVDNTRWTWPIWSCALGYYEIASLLGLSELQAENLDAQRLRARGIATAFRCRRILVEKTPNFTPATAMF